MSLGRLLECCSRQVRLQFSLKSQTGKNLIGKLGPVIMQMQPLDARQRQGKQLPAAPLFRVSVALTSHALLHLCDDRTILTAS
jgi:hypothetical protein